MKVKLVVGQGPHKGKEIAVATSAKYLIGRSSDCHLRPASQAISKRHCTLEVRNDRLYVEDLNSTNGTFVNGQPVKNEPREVANGDILKVGPLDFQVRLIDTESVAATPAQADLQTQAELQTQVETKAPPAARPAAKPAPAPASPGEHPDDEAVAAMLLDLDDNAGPDHRASMEENEDESTIMDLLVPQKESGGVAPPYRPKEALQKQTTDNTSNAAKEILDKYRRRPRS
jgi:predicted component of type VI protein secretion system